MNELSGPCTIGAGQLPKKLRSTRSAYGRKFNARTAIPAM